MDDELWKDEIAYLKKKLKGKEHELKIYNMTAQQNIELIEMNAKLEKEMDDYRMLLAKSKEHLKEREAKLNRFIAHQRDEIIELMKRCDAIDNS